MYYEEKQPHYYNDNALMNITVSCLLKNHEYELVKTVSKNFGHFNGVKILFNENISQSQVQIKSNKSGDKLNYFSYLPRAKKSIPLGNRLTSLSIRNLLEDLCLVKEYFVQNTNIINYSPYSFFELLIRYINSKRIYPIKLLYRDKYLYLDNSCTEVYMNFEACDLTFRSIVDSYGFSLYDYYSKNNLYLDGCFTMNKNDFLWEVFRYLDINKHRIKLNLDVTYQLVELPNVSQHLVDEDQQLIFNLFLKRNFSINDLTALKIYPESKLKSFIVTCRILKYIKPI